MHAHRARHVGAVDAVLVEQADPDGAGLGLGRDGTPWRVEGAGERVGRVVTARGTAILGDGRISGEVTA
jgi:hypothetical protein